MDYRQTQQQKFVKVSECYQCLCIRKRPGIYDAWNKGLKFSKGEWITFLGAGDSFLEMTQLQI